MIFKAVSKIEIGACGADGAMGASLVDYRSFLNTQTFNINAPKPTTRHRVYVDGDDVPIVSKPGRPDPLIITFQLNQMSVDNLEVFLGGALATGTYSHASERISVERSVKITADTENGEQFEMSIPRAMMVAGITGNPSDDSDGVVVLDIDCEALVPINGAGAKLSPWQVIDAQA